MKFLQPSSCSSARVAALRSRTAGQQDSSKRGYGVGISEQSSVLCRWSPLSQHCGDCRRLGARSWNTSPDRDFVRFGSRAWRLASRLQNSRAILQVYEHELCKTSRNQRLAIRHRKELLSDLWCSHEFFELACRQSVTEIVRSRRVRCGI